MEFIKVYNLIGFLRRTYGAEPDNRIIKWAMDECEHAVMTKGDCGGQCSADFIVNNQPVTYYFNVDAEYNDEEDEYETTIIFNY